MKLNLIGTFAAIGILAGCASSPAMDPGTLQASASQATQATAAAPSDDKQRVRCVNEKVTGSHLPVRTCRTLAEWDRLKEEAQRFGRDLQGAQIGPPEQQ